MPTFVMLARLAPGAIQSPSAPEEMEQNVMRSIGNEFGDGGVEWLANNAVLGPYDYLDIFCAPDIEATMIASTIVPTFGHTRTEVWAAAEWQRYKEKVLHLPAAEPDRASSTTPPSASASPRAATTAC